jgi:xanthine dehydrogenase YagS FAD-binding subunit
MNVASAIKLDGSGNINDIRLAVNAVSPRPMRLKAVEDAVRGKPANAETGEMAGKMAVEGAVPLRFNAYKIPLMRNLVKRSIAGVEAPQQARNGIAPRTNRPDGQEARWS